MSGMPITHGSWKDGADILVPPASISAPPHPRLVIIEMPAPRHAGGEAFLEGGDARRVIAAHAENPSPRRALGSTSGRSATNSSRRAPALRNHGGSGCPQSECLALPRAVDGQHVDAAAGDFRAAEENADFLGTVKAVEHTMVGAGALNIRLGRSTRARSCLRRHSTRSIAENAARCPCRNNAGSCGRCPHLRSEGCDETFYRRNNKSRARR